ncbi:MAG: hypothetical protein FWF09_00635 [Bacteroidales bacterium]|nr:hypothetical protein [Bacteroidales bacterium]
MKKDNKKNLLIKERQEAVKEILRRLETLDIGNEIRLALKIKDFSGQDLADIINCERSNIAKICKRKNNMNLVQLILMSVALEHDFFDKIHDLLTTDQKNILSHQYHANNTSTTEQVFDETHQTITIFRKQKE